MADAEFQIGDAVRPKSGGPRMTVAAVMEMDGVRQLECVWYDQHQREARRLYPESAMKPANIEALGDQ